jgi:hypothetical protein
LVEALTIVDGDKMRTRYVEDDKVLGARVRTWTRRARMAELVTITEVLKRVLLEEFTIPFLRKC